MYLYNFEVPWWVVNQSHVIYLMLYGYLQFIIASTVQLDSWKQVTDKTEKQRLIFIHLQEIKLTLWLTGRNYTKEYFTTPKRRNCKAKLCFQNDYNNYLPWSKLTYIFSFFTVSTSYQFGEVHITQHSHHNSRLTVFRSRSFVGAQGSQHWQNIS